jgi:hypothetical protein
VFAIQDGGCTSSHDAQNGPLRISATKAHAHLRLTEAGNITDGAAD